jgi:hypothetical protein
MRVKNTAAGAIINGFARIANPATSDVLVLSQMPPGTGELVCPVFHYPGRENFVYLANSSAQPVTASATLGVLDAGGKHRAVAHAVPDGVEPLAVAVTIPAFGTRRLRVVETVGNVVRISGSPALRAVATLTVPRTPAAAAGGDGGRVGTGIVCLPASRAITPGNARRFAGIDDALPATIGAAQPFTHRTRLVLREVTGRLTRYRLTVRYTLPGGDRTNHAAYSKDFLLGGDRGVLFTDVIADVTGSLRESLGDLHNASLDVEVVATANPGAVLAFLATTDNATGDVTIRHP